MRVKRYKPKHLNKAPKGRRFPATTLIACLLIAVSLTTGTSFSRYTSAASGSDSAQVAKWDIQINALPSKGMTFSGNMDDEMKESLSYNFSVGSNSEVSAKYYITVEFSGRLDSTVDLYIDGIAGTPNEGRTVFTFADDWTFAPGSHSRNHTLTLTRTYFQNGQIPENFDSVEVSISVIAEQTNYGDGRMKKRYIPSILIVLCLLIAACIGAAYAKYASVKKAEKLFSLSSDVKFEAYAAYSDTTKTLYFLNDIRIDTGKDIPGTNNDKATAVYEGILGSNVESYTEWLEYDENIETVRFLGDITPQNMTGWFQDCKNLTAIYGMAGHLHTSKVEYMDNAFAGCGKLTVLDLSGFDTGSVMEFSSMFKDCSSLETIYASESFVIPFDATLWGYALFEGCYNLVGGNGTDLSSEVTDHTYARIDGKDGLPGYFTAAEGVTVNYANVRVTVAEGAPFSWTEGKGNFANENQHHFFTGKNNIIILKTADGTLYSGNVVINNRETVAVTNGQLTLSADLVKDGATITLSAAAETQLLEEGGLVHLTATCDPAEIIPGEAFTITLTPDAGYVLPDTVTVTINGEDKTAEVTYENGVIFIPAELVTEGITISVTAEGKQKISVTTVFTSELTVTCNPTVPIPSQDFIITLAGEVLPNGVTVTIDGTEATTAYDKTAGTITIPGELLTSATTSITITEAAAPETPTAICNCTSKCGEGAANSDCPVCGTNWQSCQPMEPEGPTFTVNTDGVTNLDQTHKTENGSLIVTLTPQDTYTLPDTVTVKIGDRELTSTDGISYAGGVITIPVSLLSEGDTVSITAAGKASESPAPCGCTVKCAEDAVNADCEVCTAKMTDCIGTESQPSENSLTGDPPGCTCETKCTDLNDACTVCAADITSCDGEELKATPTCNCEIKCTDLNSGCPVCGTDFSTCKGKVPEPRPPAPAKPSVRNGTAIAPYVLRTSPPVKARHRNRQSPHPPKRSPLPRPSQKKPIQRTVQNNAYQPSHPH